MGKKLTIGFLDEDAYDEYHNMIAQGIFMSAQKHDINIIRFGHFLVHITTSNIYHEEVLLKFIEQFELDGLIFLGWARAVNNPDFRKLLGNIPMVSLGSCVDGIPGVFFFGEDYIKELLQHLIQVHKYSNIAYIAPFIPDNRTSAYLEIMERYQIYDPNYYVSEAELLNLNVSERGKRAVEILIDERHVKIDAIISLYNEETYEVINALKDRGIRVPEDIAVTSYEDGEIGRFSNPAMTTVYFPWKELGYYGCETICRLIAKNHVPLRTQVPGKVIYRDSCGCIPYSATNMKTGPLQASEVGFDQLGEMELDQIAEELAENTVFSIKEMQILLKMFKQALVKGTEKSFLMEFEMRLRKLEFYGEYEEFERIAVIFREILMPYFIPYAQEAAEKLLHAENLFHQMQMILQYKLANAWFSEDVEYNNIKVTLKEVGQILITNFNVNNLMDSLGTNLHRIGVQGCYVYLFNNTEQNLFDEVSLEFEYSEGKRIIGISEKNKNELRDFPSVLFKEDRTYFLQAHLLNIGDEFMGFVLFEPTQMDLRIYRNLSLQISTALNGIILFEKLDASYRRLMDQAHRKGMADTSGILHNIANIMNSVNVTAQSLEVLLKGNVMNDLKMANDMLEKKFDELDVFVENDPKGKLLMQYYTSLGDEFSIFRSRLQSYVGRLIDKINLIEGIINSQQNYTGIKTSLEKLNLVPVIEDVLRMSQTGIEKYGIRVIKKYGKSIIALAQRTKLFHILTNIIKNGIESMENTKEGERVLIIKISNEADNIFIRISDAGPGIAEGSLESIFAYGFTTKKNGHGFGLHSCANYMTEMKGRIWAENSINERGATFVLQFKAPPNT